jgi:hypothetical protein
MRYWPWFTTVPAVLFALSPPGWHLFYAAFLAGEQLSRNIWGPLYLTGVAVVFGLALIELFVRARIHRRRTSDSKASIPSGTET